MPHEEYLKLRAQQVRDSAANAILSQNLPNVPELPAYDTGWGGLISKVEGNLGISDETRIKWHGYEPFPETCLYTATSQYGDKDAKATANPDFKDNHEKYGFVSIPMSEATVGDLLQFSKEKTPKHSVIYTGETKEEGIPLVSYSRGGVGETTLTPEGRLPTMVHNTPIQYVTSRIGTPTAFRYVGTPAKKQEWTNEWNNKYGTQRENGRLGVTTRWSDGGFLNRSMWDELSMAEKADIMKIAIEGGVYDLDAIRNGYNEYAKGGKIHIKPENRGKFTALKKRTGHSATWFKEHGTPAQRKMATFALNARHWKH